MEGPDLNRAVSVSQQMAMDVFGLTVPARDLENVLRDVLYGGKDLLSAYQQQLVTREEFAMALAAHVHSYLVDLSGIPWSDQIDRDWSPFEKAMEQALFVL
jgi:hypothetical protein